MLIADTSSKLIDIITNIPENINYLPKRKGTCQPLKVEGKCFLDKQCKEEMWCTKVPEIQQTKCTLIKLKRLYKKKASDHYQDLEPYMNIRD